VKCNVTEYFTQKTVKSTMFGGMASNSMSLEKSNALAPSVQMDEKRTWAITNHNGIASFNLKFTKARHDLEVALICECEGVKTSLSKPMKIQNEVRKVVLQSAIDKRVEVEFKTDELGEVSSTRIKLEEAIQINALNELDRPVGGIESEELEIYMLNED